MVPVRSRSVRGCVADMIPMGIPMSNHRTAAPRTSETVTGSARAISVLIGMDAWKSRPKLPWSSPTR